MRPNKILISVALLVLTDIIIYPQEIMRNGKMVLIPSKDVSFQMGSDNGNYDEQPVHTVSFTYNFWMDSTEVTQSDYHDVFSNAYSSYLDPLWGDPYGAGDNYPAYAVEWGDAVLYCNAKSKSQGLDTVYTYTGINGRPGDGCSLIDAAANFNAYGYRLPTEAEWEFACRGGNTADFFWGKNYFPYPSSSSDSLEIDSYAVWSHNAWELSSENSNFGNHEVASKNPNVYGLYDMCGNVSEWINDWAEEYKSESQINPTGSDVETYHTVRGGNWGNGASFMRSANRQFSSPDYYVYFCGFRTVLPVDPNQTGVEENSQGSETPLEYILEQNYPNPFNPTTTITFNLPGEARVNLSVYNPLGEKVVDLIEYEHYSAGKYSIKFDGSNLSSGIYFYRFEADGIHDFKKMILLK